MKILSVTHDGEFEVDVYPREGAFVTREPVEIAFDDGAWLKIPVGFPFDGASIPPWARSLIQTLSTAGSVLFVAHDYAYAKGAGWIDPDGTYREISRWESDQIAKGLCEWLELSTGDTWRIYLALRLFGGSSFQKRPVEWSLEQWLAWRHAA